MNHLEYISFFDTGAKKHVEIAHDQPLPKNERRHSFFRMNSEEEMQQQLMVSAKFPALMLAPYVGRLNAQDKGLVKDNVFGSFEVRDHVQDANDFLQIEDVRDRCKRIAKQFIALMLYDAETRSKCSPFKGMDINRVQYEFTGPYNTQEYGCRCFFNINSKDETVNDTDITAVFS